MCLAPNQLLCLHCEKKTQSQNLQVKHLRLCDDCTAVKGLRNIYKRRRWHTQEWDDHIQRMVEFVKKGLSPSLVAAYHPLPKAPDNRERREFPHESRVFRILTHRRNTLSYLRKENE